MSAPVAPAPEPPSSADVLTSLCRQRQWQAVIDRARAQPSDVKASAAGRGALPPLHVACENGPPIQVIKALLSAHPSAAQTKSGLHDRLPLHCLLAAASTHRLVEGVVSALVEAHPGACRVPDKGGNLPIHLACQAAPVSDAIFTSILSMYPEGAYARNHAGNYPLHLAASNGDVQTKKIALASLDRGTLYASISKMTSLRLSKEHEEKTKALETSNAEKARRMEARSKEERAKLNAQIEELKIQLKTAKEGNQKLTEEMKAAAIKHGKEMALAIKKEQEKATDMEAKLREELAEVQLKNMDFLEQTEGLQADLDASNGKVQMQVDTILGLEGKLEDTTKTLDETKESLDSTKGELKQTRDELSVAQASNEEKDKRIEHLEASLQSTKESVLALAKQQQQMNAAMTSQKEALAALLLGHTAALGDGGTLAEKMVGLAATIDEATEKEDTDAEAVAETKTADSKED